MEWDWGKGRNLLFVGDGHKLGDTVFVHAVLAGDINSLGGFAKSFKAFFYTLLILLPIPIFVCGKTGDDFKTTLGSDFFYTVKGGITSAFLSILICHAKLVKSHEIVEKLNLTFMAIGIHPGVDMVKPLSLQCF